MKLQLREFQLNGEELRCSANSFSYINTCVQVFGRELSCVEFPSVIRCMIKKYHVKRDIHFCHLRTALKPLEESLEGILNTGPHSIEIFIRSASTD